MRPMPVNEHSHRRRAADVPQRPDSLPTIVSLFSGAGGLDLGFKNAGFEIAVAFDEDSAAVLTHKKNFRSAQAFEADLRDLKPDGVLENVKGAISEGRRIGVIGGPPCQGFSRANVGATETDYRNKLPDVYIEIVRILQQAYTVEFIVFENVLGIRDKKHSKTYQALLNAIDDLGFTTYEKELCATDFGVPQKRRRAVVNVFYARAACPCSEFGSSGRSVLPWRWCPYGTSSPLKRSMRILPVSFWKSGWSIGFINRGHSEQRFRTARVLMDHNGSKSHVQTQLNEALIARCGNGLGSRHDDLTGRVNLGCRIDRGCIECIRQIVSAGLKRTHLRRFRCQRESGQRRGRGIHSKIVSRIFPWFQTEYHDKIRPSAKQSCALWTEPASVPSQLTLYNGAPSR